MCAKIKKNELSAAFPIKEIILLIPGALIAAIIVIAGPLFIAHQLGHQFNKS